MGQILQISPSKFAVDTFLAFDPCDIDVFTLLTLISLGATCTPPSYDATQQFDAAWIETAIADLSAPAPVRLRFRTSRLLLNLLSLANIRENCPLIIRHGPVPRPDEARLQVLIPIVQDQSRGVWDFAYCQEAHGRFYQFHPKAPGNKMEIQTIHLGLPSDLDREQQEAYRFTATLSHLKEIDLRRFDPITSKESYSDKSGFKSLRDMATTLLTNCCSDRHSNRTVIARVFANALRSYLRSTTNSGHRNWWYPSVFVTAPTIPTVDITSGTDFKNMRTTVRHYLSEATQFVDEYSASINTCAQLAEWARDLRTHLDRAILPLTKSLFMHRTILSALRDESKLFEEHLSMEVETTRHDIVKVERGSGEGLYSPLSAVHIPEKVEKNEDDIVKMEDDSD